eukprot:GILJ01012618.1.p2 GENE.GILJ01012618.1~~GILJ01012618.1.p2  ORF type:complete len:108 (+),score=4.37 GILJ01012618.1:56-379(+)
MSVHSCHSDNYCQFFSLYGDGTKYTGPFITDTMQVGNWNISQQFGSITSTPNKTCGHDGILGLAYTNGYCQPTCVPTMMDHLVSDYGIADTFGLCLDDFGGSIVRGV